MSETITASGEERAAAAPSGPARRVEARAASATLSLEAARAAQALGRRPFVRTASFVAVASRSLDLLALALSGTGIAAFYVEAADAGVMPLYFLPVIVVPLVAIAVLGSSGAYTLRALEKPATTIGKSVAIWAGVLGAFTLLLFFLKLGDEFSRVWLASWFAVGAVLLTALRVLAANRVAAWRQRGALIRRAVLVGGGEEGAALLRTLETDPRSDVRVCGIFDDRDGERAPAVNARYPRLGRIEELVQFGRQADIDLLIVALPTTAERRLAELLRTLWVLPIDIRLSAQTSRLKLRPRSYSYIGSVPFLDLFDRPIADWDALLKRAFDLSIASAALVVLSPVLAATALAVRLDSPGPILFKQRRYGFNNALIEVYKFRSMYADKTDHDARRLATKGDPRITKVGRFIRKTSLDELPQLFNVIKGELSLVGPRPHATMASAASRVYDQIVDDYFARHRVKPGITGWAQVNGWRGETDTEEKIQKRVEYDLEYIEKWSLLLDAYILMITPIRLLNTENAY